MAEIILVTGGARSGKSVFAEKLALEKSPRRCYIATCPVTDDEMRERVERHKSRRAAFDWITVEEETELEKAFSSAPSCGVYLVDCMTLWINNLLYRNPAFRECDMVLRMEKLLQFLSKFPGCVVFVLNEVGMGIVPDNPLSRAFRDCSGRCGQMIAAEAAEVYLTVCGIPLKIKGGVSR